ncbi:alanine racemase [Flavobacteriaceae bacterium]|nr:alanine racemase [Flavobacteriaceae bacterium]
MSQEAYLTINLKSLAHNYNVLRSKINGETLLIAVVKANAYGSDGVKIAKELSALGTDYFAVAYASEGINLRKAGIKKPILVFYPQKGQLKKIIEYNLEPALYSKEIIHSFLALVKKNTLNKYPVHLKCNTGLNRIGISINELNEVLNILDESSLEVKSVYSHLGASENKKPCAFTKKQIESFELIKKQILKRYKNPPKLHLLNSSGIFNYPELKYDAVRTGIALYGFANRTEWDAELKPIAKLSAPLCQIHHLNKGESVGYNQGWVATKNSIIGVIPVGHADGIGRQYGNGIGTVQINGKPASIIGNVCMDMLMIDVSAIDCKTGDEVVFFDENTTAVDFTASANTISYEILTGLNNRIKRVYI